MQALLLGVAVALTMFVPLHLVLGAEPVQATLCVLAGAVLTAALMWFLRRAEVLRTTQAQGYFTAALMIVAIALVMLPPGYLLKNFL